MKNIITAWRLEDGAPIYLGSGRTWRVRIEEAEPLEGAAFEAALAWARERAQERSVVDPYPILVDEGGALAGRRVRETIRSTGPTVPSDFRRT